MHIAIIGGGVSGLSAAIAAAGENPSANITIFEQKPELGKKILVTGNGHCNLTNRFMKEDCYRSDRPSFVAHLFTLPVWNDTGSFFEGLGLPLKEKQGYVYPRSFQASSVRKVLVRRIKELGIQRRFPARVTEILPEGSGFTIRFQEERRTSSFRADRVILACGGKAAPVQGSDGSGYTLARSFGHRIIPVVPALVQLKVRNHPLAKAAGVRTDAKITILLNGHPEQEDTGELQITAYGISGIPVFQVSRYASRGLSEKKEVTAELDLVPEMTEQELARYFLKRIQEKNASCQCLEDLLLGFFPDKLIVPVLKIAKLSRQMRVPDMDYAFAVRLALACKQITLSIEGTNGFENAQVCAGGVSLDEIDPDTMESRLQKGLYLAGELLDIDGICGGYNIHCAVATGRIAGRSSAGSRK